MWKKRKARERAARQAEADALRASITADVLAQVQEMLSLAPTDAQGVPNLSALKMAVRNVELAQLNIKYFGYDLARKLAAALPVRTDTAPAHVGLQSKLSTQSDMESAWVAHWCGQLLAPVVFHRKMWELSYVLQAVFENGHMRAGARGLGFGCGEEPLPSYLASQGVAITVTDLGAEEAQAKGWADTQQHAASLDKAYQPRMLDRASFDRLVRIETVDMTAIPDHLRGYDFCWSVCALEHLGSIEKGLAFIEHSLETLRPGGLAVHTTEYNINSDGPTVDNWPTVLFQRRHLIALAERLRAQGHYVAEFNLDLGDKPLDRFIDLPPWRHDVPKEHKHWHGKGAHLKIAIDGFACSCFGIVVRKAG